MGRGFLAGAAVTAWASLAHAGGSTRKVTIETEPAGATIYFGDTDSEPVCQATPCTVDAPLGDVVVIVRKDSYAPMIDQLEVKKGGKNPTFKYKLTIATATLVIDAPAAKGAEIRVDEEDKGKVPAHVEVSGDDAHHVVVKMGEKTLYDDYINVGIGDTLEITPKGAGGSTAEKDPDGEGTSGGSTAGGVETSSPSRPRERFLTVSAAVDYGFRTFTYDKGMTPTSNIRDLPNQSQSMVGGALELAGSSLFRQLSIYAKYERSVVSSPVQGAVDLVPYWDSLEASLRHRWTIADVVALRVSVGYARDQYRFSGSDMDIANAPDATYGALRLAARVGYPAGMLEPYAGAETRLVVDRGEFGARFPGSSVDGFGATAGVAIRRGGLSARLEGSLLRYSWTFNPDLNTTYKADGGTEAVELLSVLVGYAY